MPKKNPLIAAIDVGTNSFHMVIASVNKKEQLRIHSRDKEMVRLGESAYDMKHLSAEAITRGVQTLERFITLAKKENAIVRAIATSAVREALNSEEFVEKVRISTGVQVEVVSGAEEGRLVYLGVIHALPLVDRKVLVCDIGGGSTETTIGVHGNVEFVHSEQLGTIRLTKRFFSRGIPSDNDVEDCREFIKGAWTPTFQAIKRIGFDVLAGTSGTFQTLARMVMEKQHKKTPDLVNGIICTREEILQVIQTIIDARVPKSIAMLPGMDAKRADILLAGALLVEQILEESEAKECVVSGYALREGIVFDTVRQMKDREEYHHLAHLRYESVQHLCRTYNTYIPHVEHVATLALLLFDVLRPIHGYGDTERELLEAAAYLHDIGYHISPDQHHKHSYYIISNSIMPGFTNDEAEIIANIARYHRKSHPKKKHGNFALLTAETQKKVVWLSAILRICEGLDRRRQQLVSRIWVRILPETIEIQCVKNSSAKDIAIELWGADRRKSLLEEVAGRTVLIVSGEKEKP